MLYSLSYWTKDDGYDENDDDERGRELNNSLLLLCGT